MLYVLQLLGSRYTAISVFATTFVSSLFHEYIIATGVKFFLPLLTILFSGFGGTQYLLIHKIATDFHPTVMFYYVRPGNLVPRELLNMLFLLGLSIGFGIMIWGYGFEMYARVICPKEVSNT